MWVISLKADEFRLVHDIGSFIFLDSPEGNVYYTIQFAVVPHAELHATDVPGHKIVQAEPNIIQCPFVLNMDDGMDVVVGAMKTRDASSYFYGVSSENLKNWSAADEKSFADTKYWITIKTTDQRIKSATVLANTESAKLSDNFFRCQKLTSIFKNLKLGSAGAYAKWCDEKPYKEVVKVVLREAEKRERGHAAQNGATSNADDVSRDGGAESE